MTCNSCNREMDAEQMRRAHYEVNGYEQDRSQGGTNHIELRKRTGKVMCNDCMNRRKAGVNPEQQGLL